MFTTSAGIMGVVGPTLAVLTGPIGIGIIAISSLVALLFTKPWIPWEEKLAKKIIEEFDKQCVKTNFVKAIEKYWADTKIAFDNGSKEVENKWQELLAKKAEEIYNPKLTKAELLALMEESKRIQQFFRCIPWEKEAK